MRTMENISGQCEHLPAPAGNPALANFVFREVQDANELLALLKLRYRVYRNSRLAGFVPENRWGIDIDEYDIRSRHFGLYWMHNGTEEPAGYLRVVEDRIIPGSHPIEAIAQRHPEFGEKTYATPAYPFPLMHYYPDAKALAADHKMWAQMGERMCEASRFVVDESFGSPRIASFIVESALATYLFYRQFGHAIWCCTSTHSSVYQRFYDMQIHGGPKQIDYLINGLAYHCLIGTLATIPDRLREKLKEMASAYQATGRIERLIPTSNLPALQTSIESRAVA